MTKVTILGDESKQKKKLKPIEVKMIIYSDGKTQEYNTKLSAYKEIKIIKINAYKSFDCIIITDDNIVFLGHFNDGVVE